jgi:phosphonate transport system substrate-binding protein
MREQQSKRNTDIEQSATSRPTRFSRGMRSVYALFAVGAILFTVLYVAQLIRQNYLEPQFGPRRAVDLVEPEVSSKGDHPDSSDRPSLRIAIAPVISPEKSIEMYRDLAYHLAAQVGRDAVVLQRATYAEINELVRYRRCDIALVCTYPFVRGEQDFGVEALVVPQVNGALDYRSLIVVPASSEAESILDLRNSRFTCADMMSNSGWLYPALWLKDRGENPEAFFGEVLVAGSHDRSLHAVSSGYADGGAVHSLVFERMVEEDPTILARTKIIQKSNPYGMPPFVVHPQMSADLKSQLRDALLSMHKEAEGRKVLASLAIDKFVVANTTMYDSVRRAVEQWESRR